MDMPKLYRYRPFRENPGLEFSFQAHEFQWQQELYDGLIVPVSPTTFNDPYDCDIVVEKSFLNEKWFREIFIAAVNQRKPLSKQEEELLRTTGNLKSTMEFILDKSLPDVFISNAYKYISDIFHNLKDEWRVACFSGTKESILMWSHYAKNHTGFCIEYDFNRFPLKLKKRFHRVSYSENRYFIPGSFANGDNESANQAIYEATLHKSSIWNYEEEWRMVFHKKDLHVFSSNEKYNYVPAQDCITAVYLGTKASEEKYKEICAHYAGTNVKVYQMQMQRARYQLEPKLIELND